MKILWLLICINTHYKNDKAVSSYEAYSVHESSSDLLSRYESERSMDKNIFSKDDRRLWDSKYMAAKVVVGRKYNISGPELVPVDQVFK